jgi:hypothetical protein
MERFRGTANGGATSSPAAEDCGKLVRAAPMRRCSASNCRRAGTPDGRELRSADLARARGHVACSALFCRRPDRSRGVTRLSRYSRSQISWTLVHSAPTATRVLDRMALVLTSGSAASIQTRSVQTLSVRTARSQASTFRVVVRQAARRVSTQRHEIPMQLPSHLTQSDNAPFKQDVPEPATCPETSSDARRRT